MGFKHVLPSVKHTLKTVQVEGTFPDGTKLVSVHSPISDVDDLNLAFYGLDVKLPTFSNDLDLEDLIPGEVIPSPIDEIELLPLRHRIALLVTNHGDRPIQIGSHYHFLEVNPFLEFDRLQAYGKKLDIPG